MACACKGKNRKQWEVVLPSGRVVSKHSVESAARAVAAKYPGSTLRKQSKAAAGKSAR